MDRKIGESEEEDTPQVTQMNLDKAAPSSESRKSFELSNENESLTKPQDDHSIEMRSVDDQEDKDESYTLHLENTDKSTRRRMVDQDFSDSRQYTLESQEGGV